MEELDNALEMSYVPPSILKKNKKNSRLHSGYQIEKIMHSINEFGFVSPIIVDEDNTILAGHARLEAAVNLGLESIPVIKTEGLSEEKKRLFVIADNRLSELSTWDMPMLMSEVDDLVGSFDVAYLDDFGIDDVFLDRMIGGFSPSLEPSTRSTDVSDQDIERKEGTLATHFERRDTSAIEVTCPHCGQDFTFHE